MGLLTVRSAALRAGLLATVGGSVLAACGDVDVTVFEADPSPTGGAPSSGGAPVLGPGGTGPGLLGGAGGDGTERVLLIDDFEDGDKKAFDPAGWWYPFDDGSGTQTFSVELADGVEPSPAPERGRVLRVSSEGFVEWGSAFGVDVLEYAFDDGPLELSFSVIANRSLSVSFHAIDASGTHFTSDFAVGPAWQRVTIRLDRLFIVDGGSVRGLEVSTLDELHWFVFDDASSVLWFDDFSFREF